MAQEIESPCTGVCQLGPDEVCKGCYRSMSEIIEWPDADRETRLEILRAAASRKSGAK